jgi:DNA-binding NtrC family response regulator
VARFLILEPSREVRELFGYVVSRLGHEALLWDGAGEGELDDVDAVLLEPAYARGRELVSRLRTHRPELPVVCASVYMPTSELKASIRPVEYLEKPFSLVDLELALERALRGPAANAA